MKPLPDYYKPMVPPFKVRMVDLSELPRRQARVYFNWYVSQMNPRIELLKRVYRDTGGEGELDETPESLTRLQRWMEQYLERRPPTQEEIERYARGGLPVLDVAAQKGASVDSEMEQSFREYLRREAQTFVYLTETSEMICEDVIFYFVKVLMNAYPTFHWRLGKGKSYICYNYPVLGFLPNWSYDVDVRRTPFGVAIGFLEGNKDENALRGTYDFYISEMRRGLEKFRLR